MLEFMHRYDKAAIQTFIHSHYEKYKCKGPYVAAWKDSNVNWHPSIRGHKVRAGNIYVLFIKYVYLCEQRTIPMSG